MNVRPICSPDMALKWKKQNIYFVLGDIFSQAAVAVCSDASALPSIGIACFRVTPAFGLACSPEQVGACQDPPTIAGAEGT